MFMAGLEQKQVQMQKAQIQGSTLLLPRVRILFCTQCKWMLRAAYFAQELLSTFSTSLGEVALVPSTGGVFVIDITHAVVPTTHTSTQSDGGVLSLPLQDERNIPPTTQTTRLWDRKVDGGFPETKNLKKLVRDVIDPSRDLGHVDGHKVAVTNPTPTSNNTVGIKKKPSGRVCVADKDPIVSSTVEGEVEEDSSKSQQQQQRRVGQDDVAKSEERGLATKQSLQEKKVCDDCA